MKRSGFVAGTIAAAVAAPAALTHVARVAAAPAIELGDDVLLRSSWRDLRGRRVGIVTNQTGVTAAGQHVVDAIAAAGSLEVTALFAPEHGLRGDRLAGASVGSYVDQRTGLPVYSLYGATRHPTEKMLAAVDVLLFDIQDVGARAYTYISTMAYVMQSARRYGKEIWVLDRPNPVGGMAVEGPVLEPPFASFIGLYPIAMRHGMTVGELARMFNDRFGIGARLRVIPMNGWRRSMIWPDTGLAWIRTSPNVPSWQTTFVYLCTGLIDNAGLNNGVGTASPFFYAGMLGIDPQRWADALAQRHLPGVEFVAATWTPASGFWKGRTLPGVRLVLTDPRAFEPVRTAVELLVGAHRFFPRALDVRAEALDRDWGTASLGRGVLAGATAGAIVAGWQPRLDAFTASRARYLLY